MQVKKVTINWNMDFPSGARKSSLSHIRRCVFSGYWCYSERKATCTHLPSQSKAPPFFRLHDGSSSYAREVQT